MERPEAKESIPGITLKRAGEEDVDIFLELEKAVGGTPVYSAMTDREEALTEIKKNFVYLISEGGQTIGSVMYEMRSPQHAYVSGLVIHPSAQGRGLGKLAMEKLLEELKNVSIIDLVTHPDNTRAIELYESLGFTIGECMENHFGDGEPRVVMTLNRSGL